MPKKVKHEALAQSIELQYLTVTFSIKCVASHNENCQLSKSTSNALSLVSIVFDKKCFDLSYRFASVRQKQPMLRSGGFVE